MRIETKAWLLSSLCLLACSTTVGTMGGPDPNGPPNGAPDLGFDKDAFWAQDPPPMTCGLDGSMLPLPPLPGGTPDCPDDKNRQGCPCVTPGQTAACWPGLRKNRNLGICRDGTTTCVQTEVGSQWGACMGYTLPVPGADSGPEACNCFSAGRWKIDNVVPCFYRDASNQIIGAMSSHIVGMDFECVHNPPQPLPLPTETWSTNALKVDCVGRWKLCYTLKAGDAKNPLPTDCVLASVCTMGDYTTANMEQSLPQLPAWVTSTPAQVACAAAFAQSGGYGEMSVDGLTVACDKVQKVFNRGPYCPLKCGTNPTDPDCLNCVDGSMGNF